MGFGNESPIAALKRAHAADSRYRSALEKKLADLVLELADVKAERDILANRLGELRASGVCLGAVSAACPTCSSPSDVPCTAPDPR